MASIMTSRASRGLADLELSSIILVSRAWSSEPQLTADADGLLVLDGDLDHGAEVVVVFAADGAVAGVDAVLG